MANVSKVTGSEEEQLSSELNTTVTTIKTSREPHTHVPLTSRPESASPQYMRDSFPPYTDSMLGRTGRSTWKSASCFIFILKQLYCTCVLQQRGQTSQKTGVELREKSIIDIQPNFQISCDSLILFNLYLTDRSSKKYVQCFH